MQISRRTALLSSAVFGSLMGSGALAGPRRDGRLGEVKPGKPLSLEKFESFYVGGTSRRITGPFGDDEIMDGTMYVQRLVPAEKRFPLPLIFIHGGAHTGVTWETTPDGREGWQLLFTRAGFETIVVDQFWRGRSPADLTPISLGYAPGPDSKPLGPVVMSGKRLAASFARGGDRFPMASLDQYASQLVPDFAVPKALAAGNMALSDPLSVAPVTALLDKVGPAVLVTHSQGGHLGWRATLARPDKVAAIIAVEPGVTSPGLDDPAFPDIPVYVMWGDNLPKEGPNLSLAAAETARRLGRRRPKIHVDLLPEHGIRGNGHMMMMENNNDVLAQRPMNWLQTLELRERV